MKVAPLHNLLESLGERVMENSITLRAVLLAIFKVCTQPGGVLHIAWKLALFPHFSKNLELNFQELIRILIK